MSILNSSHPDDKLLVAQLKNGNERAFEKLYEKYSGGIYGFSLKLLKSTDFAEEVVQDVFLKVWNTRNDLDVNLNFKSFIYTIAKNQSLNILKRAANDLNLRDQLLYTQETFSTSTKDNLLNKEYENVKRNAINSLSSGRRRIFLMSREEGLSYEEIAKNLGISVNTVKTQMKTALKNIRKHLSKHGDMDFLIFHIIYFTFF
ncbi:RNA polymerase sigma factor [Salegentibacter maritimus]|uniref:RNA polymerase sigma factor n=1 Tax=Salegentibacter maritimus TaxID=2794347 RepID=A0ABS0TIP2_9FLAO|nr:RNA polymerase sigma-70 factor [Salegentibacter maritimus]MBI6120887.1 RNA polymerase sigma-70 factor [Salegentibacter maritimus]